MCDHSEFRLAVLRFSTDKHNKVFPVRVSCDYEGQKMRKKKRKEASAGQICQVNRLRTEAQPAGGTTDTRYCVTRDMRRGNYSEDMERI